MRFNDIDSINTPETLSYLQRCISTRISLAYSPLPLVHFLLSVPTLITVDPRPNDLSIILYNIQRSSAAIAINQIASTETQNCTLFFPMLVS